MPKCVENYEHSIADVVVITALVGPKTTTGTVLAMKTTLKGAHYEVLHRNGSVISKMWFSKDGVEAIPREETES